MTRRHFLKLTAATTTALAASNPIRAATPAAPAPDLTWHDVRQWGLEGRAFNDTDQYFDRLPARAKGVVRDAVWNLSRHTAGMTAFFETDAPAIHVRYTLTQSALAMPHMPATGVSGVDLYGRDASGWHWVATHLPKTQTIETTLVDRLAPGRRIYHLNLPLYNGVSSLEIGVPKTANFTPVPPRKDKPILFYGTSITQGGCASRPGMAFTHILARRLDRPVLNFGFSGNGRTEVEVARFLAELDPALFILDTSANTPTNELTDRTRAVVTLLRERHATMPILLLDERPHPAAPLVPHLADLHRQKTDALRKAHDQLTTTGDKNLHFLKGDNLLLQDGEATVDGSHPTDLGMLRYATTLEPTLRQLLTN